MAERALLKNRLREALAIRNMRAADLVEKTGVPKSAISFYLAGKSSPKSDRLYIIAKALDVSEAWLLGFDVPMYRTDEQKKNDQLAELVDKLRGDDKFYEVVVRLASADADQLDLVDRLLAGLMSSK